MAKILLVDNGLPFDFETLYTKPLGGSEIAIFLLSKGLADLGQQVVLLGSSTAVPRQQGNIMLDHVSNVRNYAPASDVIVFNRAIDNILDPAFGNKPIYYMSHDAYDQPNVHWMPFAGNIIERLSKIICVSVWQCGTFSNYLNVPTNKLTILGNPIDMTIHQGFVERKPNRLIYASVPYKGLPALSKLFDDICIQSQRDDLELHIFSSMNLYQNKEGDREFEQHFSLLARQKGVFLHDVVSTPELAKEFAASSLYIHPQLYHETFGMNWLQCQAMGCIPITTNKGAAQELIIDGQTGFITRGRNIEHKECYDEFVNLTCIALEQDLYTMRLAAEKHAKQWDHVKLSRKLLDIMQIM